MDERGHPDLAERDDRRVVHVVRNVMIGQQLPDQVVGGQRVRSDVCGPTMLAAAAPPGVQVIDVIGAQADVRRLDVAWLPGTMSPARLTVVRALRAAVQQLPT